MPRHMAASASLGRFRNEPLGQIISGSSSRLHAETLDRRARLLVGGRVEHRVRIGVARQKTLQPHQIGRAGAADQQRADAALLDQRDAAQDEGAHDDLAEFGRADHQRADMRGVERQRRAAFGTGLRRRQRAAAGELADLAGKLALGEQDHRSLPVQAVAAHDLEPAVEHQPGRALRMPTS